MYFGKILAFIDDSLINISKCYEVFYGEFSRYLFLIQIFSFDIPHFILNGVAKGCYAVKNV